MRRRGRIALVGALTIGLLTACTADPRGHESSRPGGVPTSLSPRPAQTPAGPSPQPSTEQFRVTLRRTGGIAGVSEELVVDSTGQWRTSKGTHGQLTQQQNFDLFRLVFGSQLETEASAPPARGCADAFTYELSATVVGKGNLGVRRRDCGDLASAAPRLNAVVTWLRGATGF